MGSMEFVMYQEFVNQNMENSTPCNFNYVSKKQKKPNAHVAFEDGDYNSNYYLVEIK